MSEGGRVERIDLAAQPVVRSFVDTFSHERFLREIRFEGDGTALRTMVMTEVSGDITTTTFSGVDMARRFTDAETTRLFSLP